MDIGDIVGMLFPVAITAAGAAYAMVRQMQAENLKRDNDLKDSVNKLKGTIDILQLQLDQTNRTIERHDLRIQKLTRAVLRIPEAGLGDDSSIDLNRRGFKDTLY